MHHFCDGSGEYLRHRIARYTSTIAGPATTRNTQGRMKTIIGSVSNTGSRPALVSYFANISCALFGRQRAQRHGHRRAVLH